MTYSESSDLLEEKTTTQATVNRIASKEKKEPQNYLAPLLAHEKFDLFEAPDFEDKGVESASEYSPEKGRW